jgi:hypothetical protein
MPLLYEKMLQTKNRLWLCTLLLHDGGYIHLMTEMEPVYDMLC